LIRSLDCIVIRRAEPSDRSDLLKAVIELQDYERQLHETRLPGEQIADLYTRWLLSSAEGGGLALVAGHGDVYVGFAAGWIEHEENVAQTSESNRFGFISDICVLSDHRGKRIIGLEAIVGHFELAGITRVRLGVLAANRSARLAYECAGFEPYKMIYEKTLRR
jgi:ribosomal protein S18 acetylase RimI-like enzyme